MRIISIVEFGSSARSDDDIFSDRDFFVWVDVWDDRSKIILEAKKKFEYLNHSNCDFIIHDTKSFDFMLERGSLFLWHLKLEAKPLFGKDSFGEKIENLVEFSQYEYKFTNYLEVFKDLKKARLDLPITTSFDYSVLFSVIRNLCILTCYRMGNPKFGRKSAFKMVYSKHNYLEIDLDDYDFLLNKKLEYERGFSIVSNKDLDIEYFISKVEIFANQIKNILDFEE